MGDLLDSRSLTEQDGFLMDDVPGRISRPKSMYEGSNLRLVNNTNQVSGTLGLTYQYSFVFNRCCNILRHISSLFA